VGHRRATTAGRGCRGGCAALVSPLEIANQLLRGLVEIVGDVNFSLVATGLSRGAVFLVREDVQIWLPGLGDDHLLTLPNLFPQCRELAFGFVHIDLHRNLLLFDC